MKLSVIIPLGLAGGALVAQATLSLVPSLGLLGGAAVFVLVGTAFSHAVQVLLAERAAREAAATAREAAREAAATARQSELLHELRSVTIRERDALAGHLQVLQQWAGEMAGAQNREFAIRQADVAAQVAAALHHGDAAQARLLGGVEALVARLEAVQTAQEQSLAALAETQARTSELMVKFTEGTQAELAFLEKLEGGAYASRDR